MTQKPALERTRNRHLLLSDVAIAILAPLLAYLIRFEGVGWGTSLVKEAIVVAAWLTPVHLAIFTLFGIYRCLWAHASAVELERLMAGASVSAFSSFAVGIF